MAIKGRGTAQTLPGRFQATDTVRLPQEAPDRVHSEYIREAARTILSKNDSPDVPFEQSINAYRGCEHGCIYCYARPAHAYVDLSPGIDFETKIFFKPDAARLLESALAKPGYRPRTIALGTNTDPYQPAERNFELTREILDVLAEHRHPVSIVTKSSLVERDIDLLSQMARDNLVRVMISVTTLDRQLKRTLEPRASSPEARLATIRHLVDAGIPTGALVAPVIPALNDHEIEAIVEAVARAGADKAGYILLRLPWEVRPLFENWLDEHYPLRKDKVMNILRSCRGGRDNDPRFGHRMRGSGPYATLIRTRFSAATRRSGLEQGESADLDTSLFSAPARTGDQFSLGF